MYIPRFVIFALSSWCKVVKTFWLFFFFRLAGFIVAGKTPQLKLHPTHLITWKVDMEHCYFHQEWQLFPMLWWQCLSLVIMWYVQLLPLLFVGFAVIFLSFFFFHFLCCPKVQLPGHQCDQNWSPGNQNFTGGCHHTTNIAMANSDVQIKCVTFCFINGFERKLKWDN